MIFRIGAITFVVTLFWAVASHAAVLNQSISLRADVLTVGDVFTDAGANKDHVLGPAPKPGDLMVLDTNTLSRISRTFAVDWKPVRGTENTVVRRSTAFSAKDQEAEKTVSIPVLANPMSRDDVITAGDVIMMNISSKKLRDDTVLKASDLIGQSARGLLQPNEPVSSNLLVSPKVIKRGDIVTLSLNAGRINLTSKAKALHDARIGEMVRLQNPDSEKFVQARVTGPQEAVIETERQGG